MAFKVGSTAVSTLKVGSTPVSRLALGSAQVWSAVTPAETFLLLHFDGNFNDSSPNALTVTPSGNATTSTTQSKFGGASGYFDGFVGTNIATTDPQLGTGDWTIELWFKADPILNPTHATFLANYAPDGSAGFGFYFNSADSGQISCYRGNDFYFQSSNFVVDNAWHHLALVRSNDVITLFIDGTPDVSAPVGSSVSFSGPAMSIGTSPETTDRDFNGYIDELRIIKGYAAYTSNFTPPELPFGAELSLLLNFEGADSNTGAPTDSSPNAHALTVSGNAYTLFSTTQSKFGVSGYFDDSTYLNVPAHPSLNLGAGDFTIDMWAWLPANGTYTGNTGTIFSNGGTGSNTFALFWNPSYGFGESLAGGAANTNSLSLFVGNAYLRAEPAFEGSPPQLDAWNHIAIVRRAGVINFYLNGQSMSFAAGATNTFADPIDLAGWALSGLAIGYDAGQTGGNDFFGYLDEFRIVKGAALYGDNFTPPELPYGVEYDLNINFNDPLNIVDTSPAHRTITNTGVSITSLPDGSLAGEFTFPARLLVSSFPALGTGDFTIEFWWRPIGTPAIYTEPHIIGQSSWYGSFDWNLVYGANGDLIFYSFNNFLQTPSSVVTPSNWMHIAIVRQSGTLTIYVNGTNVVSAAFADDIASTTDLAIGADVDGMSGVDNYMDDIKIVVGCAKYTDNFTPPPAPA